MSDDRSRAERAPGTTRDEGAREGWFDRLFELFQPRARESLRTDLEDALAETAQDFSPQERAMLKNVLAFHHVRVEDVMVPRADIVAIAEEITLGELLAVFRTAGHSRLPVYGETLDDPKGMVHIRDFLDHIATCAEVDGSQQSPGGEIPPPNLGDVDLSVPLAETRILRPVLYVPRSMPAVDLLVRMQATRTHMALVIDEYGGTDGLVSIEDIVESVVGDIEDEHDEAEAGLIQAEPGDSFLVDARARLEEVSEALGFDIAAGDVSDDVHTVGGLIVTIAGRVPAKGEVVAGPENLVFEVLDADLRRVQRLRIFRREAGSNGTPEAPAVASAPVRTVEPAPTRAVPEPTFTPEGEVPASAASR